MALAGLPGHSIITVYLESRPLGPGSCTVSKAGVRLLDDCGMVLFAVTALAASYLPTMLTKAALKY